MRSIYRKVADIILAIHILVVVVILFGWLFPKSYFWIYQVTVVLTFVLGLVYRGTCILTKYEWNFRRKYHVGDFNDKLFIPYYLRKYLRININEKVWNIFTISLIIISFFYVMLTLFK